MVTRLINTMIATGLATSGFFVPLPAVAQMPPVREVIEVRLNNVDVIVTDRTGKYVHGLTSADFEVFDSGKRQEITNFSEITHIAKPSSGVDPQEIPRPAPAAPPSTEAAVPRHFFVLFDALSTSTIERHRVAPAVSAVMATLRATDDMMIATWNRRLTIVQRPTNDRARLEDALARAAREPSLGSDPLWPIGTDNTRDPNLPIAPGGAEKLAYRIVLQENAVDIKSAATAVTTLLGTLGGVDGRKILLLVSSGFSPDRDSHFSDALAPMAMELVSTRQMANPLDAMVLSANAAGVTMYTIFASAMAPAPELSASVGYHERGRARRITGDMGLEYLANSTGGALTTNTNAFTKAAERLEADLSNYYSIGYRMPTARDNRERAIDVRTKNRAYSVRHRTNTVQRTFERETLDTVRAGVWYPLRSNDLGIAVTAREFVRRDSGNVAFTADVEVPLANLAFTEGKEDLTADISIFVSSGDGQGATSPVRTFREVLRVPAGQLAAARGQHYSYRLDIDLRGAGAANRLVVGVLDNTSHATGFATVGVPSEP